MELLRFALVGAISLSTFVPAAAGAAVASPDAPAGRIAIPASAPASAPHALTLPEIVTLREIEDVRISPDGKTIAFLVKQASLPDNDYRVALFLLDGSGGVPVKVLEEKSVPNLRWAPDGKSLTYLSGEGDAAGIWRVAPPGGRPELLFRHATPIGSYEWSGDGTRVAFLTATSPTEDQKARLDAAGVVYDDTWMNVRDVGEKNWIPSRSELWVADPAKTGSARRVWENTRTITDVAWSPDGRRLAVTYSAPAGPDEPLIAFNSDIAIVPADGGPPAVFADSARAEVNPAWSPDGRSLAYFAVGDIVASNAIVVRPVEGGAARNVTSPYRIASVSDLSWSGDGAQLVFSKSDREASGVFAVAAAGGAVRRLNRGEDHLDRFSFDRSGRRAACRRQNTMSPPEVAVLDVASGEPRTLTALNPELRNVTLGRVRELSWKNRLGYETNGYLIEPVGYAPGRRYPFLLMLYGFSNTFISQAEWISSYPAQVFAARGWAVLLMNYPRYDTKWKYGDFEQAFRQEAYSPLASIEKAHATVVEMGIADPKRSGIMGWSYGSFLTDFTITHAPGLFQAASSGEGGLYDDGLYWLSGSQSFRRYQRGLFGGPPWGETYARYLEISPALNAAKVKAPLLKEYEPNNVPIGLQIFGALRTLGKPVELVFYPDEGHIFSQPRHRISSMQRNLDWMSFWLLGEEDPDPGKRDQYARWRTLREGSPKGDAP